MYEIFDGLRWIKVLIRKRKGGPVSSSGAQRMLSHGIQGNPRDGVIVVNEGERVFVIDGELRIVKWP